MLWRKKKWVREILDKLLTNNNNWAEGRSAGLLARQESTNLWKSSDQSPPDRVGESFWAMWYKALIAFMLNKGGFLSAEIKKEKKKINTRINRVGGYFVNKCKCKWLLQIKHARFYFSFIYNYMVKVLSLVWDAINNLCTQRLEISFPKSLTST